MISQLLVAFVAIALVVFIYFMFYGRYLDVQVIVQSNEVERRAINAAQVLMSSKDLVWSDSAGGATRYYRAVFNESKLDEQMVSAANYAADPLQPLSKGVLKNYLTFPGTVTDITVRSADTDDAWFTSFADFSNAGSTSFYACVANSIDLRFLMKYDACVKTYAGSNTFEKEFPVMLMDASKTLHPAIMTVVMTSASTGGGSESTITTTNVPCDYTSCNFPLQGACNCGSQTCASGQYCCEASSTCSDESGCYKACML